MTSLWIAALFAVFVWWFSTGLVLLLDNLPRTSFRWSRLLSTLLAVGALAGLAHTAGQTTLAATYCAFTCALLVWGWHELSFLTGWVTGPRRTAVAAQVQGWPRFKAAVMAILWHELAIAGGGLLILAITWGQANQVGLWTYAVLWLMRISAKLNLFLGVRNLSEEFLPPHLAYMGSFFRRRRMNALLPVAVAAASWVSLLIIQAALHPDTDPVAAVGLTLVATLLVLAIVEHALMVLPVQPSALWRWAMRHHDDSPPGGGQFPGGPAARSAPRTTSGPAAEATRPAPRDKPLLQAP
jgi:putative photosynthetic complex assembly protein 2